MFKYLLIYLLFFFFKFYLDACMILSLIDPFHARDSITI